MAKKKFRPADFIAFTPKYEVYVDLYGFSVGWSESIKSAIHDMYRMSTTGANDSVESYSAYMAGGVGVRFVTDDLIHAKKVQRKATQLLNLARKTYKKDSLYYHA